MRDGTYRLIEVKGDNMIEDVVVKAKEATANDGIKYISMPT